LEYAGSSWLRLFAATFRWHKPYGGNMVPGSTQSLTGMITKSITWWVKAAGAEGSQSCHPHVPIIYKLWESQASGALRVFPSLCITWFWLSILEWIEPDSNHLMAFVVIIYNLLTQIGFCGHNLEPSNSDKRSDNIKTSSL